VKRKKTGERVTFVTSPPVVKSSAVLPLFTT
jgi:hypothetical protein